MLATAGDGLVLFRNNNSGTFTNVSSSSGLNTQSAEAVSWGDYDNDGDVDLFAGRLFGNSSDLYRNNGNGTFTNVSAASGVNPTQVRAGIWGDYENDGDLDLFVVRRENPSTQANQPDILYRNNGNGTFTNIASSAGVAGRHDRLGRDGGMGGLQ